MPRGGEYRNSLLTRTGQLVAFGKKGRPSLSRLVTEVLLPWCAHVQRGPDM